MWPRTPRWPGRCWLSLVAYLDLTDIRVQEQQDYPKLHIDVDRTKASQAGLTEHDVVNNMLVALSGSFQVSPMYYLNPKNGVQYSIVVQNPQYAIQSDQDIKNIPLSSSNQTHHGLLTDISTLHRAMEPALINHYNIRRVVDIYGAIQGRDLGAVGREVNQIVDRHKKDLPRGSFVTLRGQFGTMQSAASGQSPPFRRCESPEARKIENQRSTG